jgi:hypothetical protein
VDGPPLQGSVYGGHAPITGSHLYVLQPGTSGYGSAASSLLGTGSTTTPDGYTLSSNTSDPNVPTGAQYVTTDGNGAFNITGAYKCTPTQPVYLYAYGGLTGNGTFPGSGTSIFSISSIVIGKTSGSGASQAAPYTITINSTQPLTSGQKVTVSGLTGNFTFLNNTSQTVLTSPAPANTTFTFTATTRYNTSSNLSAGTYTTSNFGTAGEIMATVAYTNPIVELATLGICPTAGNFSTGNTALSYIYMNEVSTVATAYTFQPFTLASNNNAWDIGTKNTKQALAAIANAANTAAQLYNIQGTGPDSTTNNGEGHIANIATTAGNGTVPQATIDSLANIVAACVDSSPTNGGALSAQCTGLFSIATDNGETPASGDTAPIDTATAALNIARYPQGNYGAGTGNVDSTYTADLNALPTGIDPYTPNLGTNAPKDWSIAITYNGLTSPGGIAIDADGNAFVPTNSSSSGYVTELSPQGAVLNTSATGGKGFDSIAIDSGGNVFVAANTSNALYAYTSSLGAVTGSPFAATAGVGPTSVVVDSSANGNSVYLTGSNNSNQIIQRFSNTATATPAVASASTISNGCLAHVNYITLDASDDFWAGIGSSNSVCRITNGGTQVFSDGGYSGPTNVAIDSHGNGWFGAGQQTNLYRISSTGSATAFGVINNNAQGGLSSPSWVAIDGANNVWVTNNGNSYALAEFSNNGTTGPAITSTTGYESGVLDAPSFIAIDPSGDVWIPNKSANTVTEIIGIAAPTSTPLSNLTPGTEP